MLVIAEEKKVLTEMRAVLYVSVKRLRSKWSEKMAQTEPVQPNIGDT